MTKVTPIDVLDNISELYQELETNTPTLNGETNSNYVEEYSLEDFATEMIRNQEFEQGEWDLASLLRNAINNNPNGIRIALTAEDAKNGNWIEVNPDFWGDTDGLRIETREDGAVLIYEGSEEKGWTPLGWTYPSVDNNIYGIMTQTSDGFLVSNYTDSSGVTYYRQKNGFYISIDGKIYRNAFGNKTTPIFTNLGHIEVDGITYYEQPGGGGYVNEYGCHPNEAIPVAYSETEDAYYGNNGKKYSVIMDTDSTLYPSTYTYLTDEEGNLYIHGGNQTLFKIENSDDLTTLDTDDGSASVNVDTVKFERGGEITESVNGENYSLVEDKTYQRDKYANYDVYINEDGEYFYRSGPEQVTQITDDTLLVDKPQE